MGLLRDTYNITEVDMSGIEREMSRKNDIEEQYNKETLATKDRVDISLREYEELKDKAELVRKVDWFFYKLERCTGVSKEVLLKVENLNSILTEDIPTRKFMLHVTFEFKRDDFMAKY